MNASPTRGPPMALHCFHARRELIHRSSALVHNRRRGRTLAVERRVPVRIGVAGSSQTDGLIDVLLVLTDIPGENLLHRHGSPDKRRFVGAKYGSHRGHAGGVGGGEQWSVKDCNSSSWKPRTSSG